MRTAVGDIDGRWTNDTCSGLSVYVHACPWCGSQMEFEDKEMFGYAVAHPLQPDSLCWLGKTMNDGIRVPDVRGANVVTSRWLAYEAWEHHWKGLVTPPPAAQQTEEAVAEAAREITVALNSEGYIESLSAWGGALIEQNIANIIRKHIPAPAVPVSPQEAAVPASSECPICGKDSPHYHSPQEQRAHYFPAPWNPTEKQWGGLARSIMMWIDMSGDGPKLPEELLKHLERSGIEAPAWLLEESEMKALGHSMSKGSRCVLIYKAMLADYTAPTGETKP